MKDFQNTIIASKIRENDLISSFLISPFPESFLKRKPAQYLLLKLPQANSWTEAHPFTIVDNDVNDSLKITVKNIGNFTATLHSVPLPQVAQISGPFGEFAKSVDTEARLVYIAGGIGITPFLSLLRHQAKTKSRARIALFWANNKPEDYFGLNFLNELESRLDLRTFLAVGDLNGNFGVNKSTLRIREGLLTADLIKECLEIESSKFFMCGSENMQKHVFEQLALLGVAPEVVETERIGVYMKTETPISVRQERELPLHQPRTRLPLSLQPRR